MPKQKYAKLLTRLQDAMFQNASLELIDKIKFKIEKAEKQMQKGKK